MAKKVVLAGACRTAIGTMGGSLSTVPAAELGAIVIKEALNRAGVAPEAVDQVLSFFIFIGQNLIFMIKTIKTLTQFIDKLADLMRRPLAVGSFHRICKFAQCQI